MRLADYERPATLRGLHGSHTNTASFDRPKWLGIVRSVLPHGGWFKIVDTGSAGQKEWAGRLRGAGIMPIIRPFLPTCTPTPHAIKAYIVEGITRWIEPWNEPNIDDGWPAHVGFAGVAELAEAWLAEAEKILSWGGYPAFPSFAECGPHPDVSSVKWYKLLFAYMGNNCRDRARAIFQGGAWLAVHDAVLNRFWKDQEGKYHFEHPYSELVYERIGWRPTLWEDDMSLIGHQVPVWLMKKHLGADIEVPVISTEGGIFAGLIGVQADGAYPAFDEADHAADTVAMYRWLERYQKSYPWYFGMCPWKFAPFGWQHDAWPGDNWIRKGGKRLAVVEAVKTMDEPDPDAKPIGPIGLFEEERMVDSPLASWRKGVPLGNYTKGPTEKTEIVLHSTGGSFTSAVNWFLNPESGFAAQYVIGRGHAGVPKIYQLVREEDIGHHAGEWEVNTKSIGIECADDNLDHLTAPQRERLIALCKDIMGRNPIERIRLHREIVATKCPQAITDTEGAQIAQEVLEATEAKLLARIAELEAREEELEKIRADDKAAMTAARNTLNQRIDA